jgi:hypothetical protein
MPWFIIKDNTPVEQRPGKMIVLPDGSKHPHNIVDLWTPADLLAVGLYEGVKAPTSPGRRATGRAWTWTGSAVEEVLTTEPLPAPPTKRERFDSRAANADPVIEAIIAGLAELKGLPVPAAKAWLRRLM